MRRDLLEDMQTWFKRLLAVVLLLMIGLAGWGIHQGSLTAGHVARGLGRLTGLPILPLWQVALVAGHRGFDSGAVCEDGLTEVSITTAVADETARRLRRQRVAVRVLDEYDPRLNGLRVDALVSLHVDSCVSFSGFKAASAVRTQIPEQDAALVACLEQHYSRFSGLSLHPNTITHDMTGYHAFQRVHDATPAAIIELGFLGGDRELLTNGQDQVAEGLVQGVMCFLQGDQ